MSTGRALLAASVVLLMGSLLVAQQALDLGQALLQHLHVEIEADGLHLAALLHPQQVAHAADLHVAHRQLITGAELGEFLDRPQPLPPTSRSRDG